MNRTPVLLALLALLLVPPLARSQTPKVSGSERRIVTRTRLQALFSDLETQLLKAQQDQDETTMNHLLGDDFQVWTPAPPGDPIPREDWIQQGKGQKILSFHLRQLAARDLGGDHVVVSFVLSQSSSAPRATGSYFVVDVWAKDGDTWQLTDRYAARLSGTARLLPAKPTGKE